MSRGAQQSRKVTFICRLFLDVDVLLDLGPGVESYLSLDLMYKGNVPDMLIRPFFHTSTANHSDFSFLVLIVAAFVV